MEQSLSSRVSKLSTRSTKANSNPPRVHDRYDDERDRDDDDDDDDDDDEGEFQSDEDEEDEDDDVESYVDDDDDYAKGEIDSNVDDGYDDYDRKEEKGDDNNNDEEYEDDEDNDDDDHDDDDHDDTEGAKCTELLDNDTIKSMEDMSYRDGDDDDDVTSATATMISYKDIYLEDSQVIADFIEYDGAAISVSDARVKLGLLDYDGNQIVHFVMHELTNAIDGSIDYDVYVKGMSRLIGTKYIYSNAIERSIMNYILDQLFSSFDNDDYDNNNNNNNIINNNNNNNNNGRRCSAVELGCALLLFTGEDVLSRSQSAWDLLILSQEYEGLLDYAAIVRCVSAIIKAQLCLNPETPPRHYLTAIDMRAKLEVSAFYPTYVTNEGYMKEIDSSSSSSSSSSSAASSMFTFIEMMSCILYMCQGEAMELELDKYNITTTTTTNTTNTNYISKMNASSSSSSSSSSFIASNRLNSPLRNQISKDNYSESIEEIVDANSTNGNDDDEEEEEFDIDNVGADDNDDGREEVNNRNVRNMSFDAFSGDDDDDDDDDDDELIDSNVYLKDKFFPPSSVVLELRAVRSILGLKQYKAADLLESLGSHCQAGMLKERSWIQWLAHMTYNARVSDDDLVEATMISSKIFRSFYEASNHQSFNIGDDEDGNDDNNYDEGDSQGRAVVSYQNIVVGMSFLCGGSALEERLMVAFTVMDSDCDGLLSMHEFTDLIFCALIIISVCSTSVEAKIMNIAKNDDVSLLQLARITAREAIMSYHSHNNYNRTDDEDEYDEDDLKRSSRSSKDDLISMDMIVDMTDDFLKLAAMF